MLTVQRLIIYKYLKLSIYKRFNYNQRIYVSVSLVIIMANVPLKVETRQDTCLEPMDAEHLPPAQHPKDISSPLGHTHLLYDLNFHGRDSTIITRSAMLVPLFLATL